MLLSLFSKPPGDGDCFGRLYNLRSGLASIYAAQQWVSLDCQPTIRDKIKTGSAATSQRLNVASLHLKPHFSLDVWALERRAGRCAPSSDFVFAIRSTLRQSSRTGANFSN